MFFKQLQIALNNYIQAFQLVSKNKMWSLFFRIIIGAPLSVIAATISMHDAKK